MCNWTKHGTHTSTSSRGRDFCSTSSHRSFLKFSTDCKASLVIESLIAFSILSQSSSILHWLSSTQRNSYKSIVFCLLPWITLRVHNVLATINFTSALFNFLFFYHLCRLQVCSIYFCFMISTWLELWLQQEVWLRHWVYRFCPEGAYKWIRDAEEACMCL